LHRRQDLKYNTVTPPFVIADTADTVVNSLLRAAQAHKERATSYPVTVIQS
jgi:hypothetical protein